MVIIGLLISNTEMTIVSLVIFLIILLIIFGTHQKFKRFYEETEDYFMLIDEYSTYQVYYKDIIDWTLSSKQIGVLDKTRSDDRYIFVNLAFSDPQILLEELIKMTLSGNFSHPDAADNDDSNREQEFIDYLQKNGYDELVEKMMKGEQEVNA